jgi:hypothetical protein
VVAPRFALLMALEPAARPRAPRGRTPQFQPLRSAAADFQPRVADNH